MINHIITALNIATDKLSLVLQQRVPPSADVNVLEAQEILLDLKQKCVEFSVKAEETFNVFEKYPANVKTV